MFVVHQPYFIPWLGYFAKLYYANNFFVLNDVQFSKRHNIDRAFVVGMNSEPITLNIPCGENLGCKINDIKVENFNFINKILKTIEYSYKTSKVFEQEWDWLKNLLYNCMRNGNQLDTIDMCIINDIVEHLGLIVNTKFSSDYESVNDRTERIILASEIFNDRELLLGDGKSVAVHDINRLKSCNIKIYQLNYFTEHPIYFQCRRQKTSFLKCMSILDAILNIGLESTKDLLGIIKPSLIVY